MDTTLGNKPMNLLCYGEIHARGEMLKENKVMKVILTIIKIIRKRKTFTE